MNIPPPPRGGHNLTRADAVKGGKNKKGRTRDQIIADCLEDYLSGKDDQDPKKTRQQQLVEAAAILFRMGKPKGLEYLMNRAYHCPTQPVNISGQVGGIMGDLDETERRELVNGLPPVKKSSRKK